MGLGGRCKPDPCEIAPYLEDQPVLSHVSSVALRSVAVSTSPVVAVVQKFVGSAVLVQRVAPAFHWSLRNHLCQRCQDVRGRCLVIRPCGGGHTRTLRNLANCDVVSLPVLPRRSRV